VPNDTPLVSIIIPTFNRAYLIGETLDSVLAQTYQNWECIVVDDGSTDNTAEIMESYILMDARFQYHQRPKNRLQGGNAARNYGFEVSKGDYIQWFDSDDIMLPEYLFLRMKEFKDEHNFIICSGSSVDENLKEIEQIDLIIKENLYKDYVLWKTKILTPCVIFTRSFLEVKELFNDKILRGQESEFFSRIFFDVGNEQYKIINLPLFLYRQHTGTKTTENKVYNPKFKKDQIDLLIENFKRALIMADGEFQNKLYRGIVMKFFQAIDYRCPENGLYIIKKMTTILRRLNIYFGLKFYVLGHFSLLVNKKSDRIKSQFMSIKFN
jgi:glycosyltransferase involved in cell wall biosynthesis